MELTESYKGENGEIDWKRKTKCTQWSENPCIYPVSLFINSESALDVDPDCFLFRTSYLTKNNLPWYVDTQISSPTRNHSLKIRLQHCALWWSTQTEETCFKKSMQLKTTRRESKSLLLGHTSSKWCVGFKLFMIAKLSIETSNVLTCSSPKQVSLNWEIWTSPKLLSVECFKLKQGLRIMQALKYGKTDLMITKVIFGV